MVALLSQCFDDSNITKSEKFESSDLTVTKNSDQKKLESGESYPFPPQREYPDLPKPKNSDLLKKDNSVLNSQLSDLSDYVEHLEQMVVDYKKYIEERFNRVNDQKYRVIENFEMGGKNTNDLLIYIITCVFVLLLVDYIFKMGKSSY